MKVKVKIDLSKIDFNETTKYLREEKQEETFFVDYHFEQKEEVRETRSHRFEDSGISTVGC